MSIDHLLKVSKLRPEEVDRAFAHALRSLHLVDRNDPLTKLLAKKIIEIGATGALDPAEISSIAVKRIGLS